MTYNVLVGATILIVAVVTATAVFAIQRRHERKRRRKEMLHWCNTRIPPVERAADEKDALPWR